MQFSDRIESPPGIPGMQGSRRINGGIATYKNAANEVAQISTITIGTAANSTKYTVIIDGITIDYTSDATATATEIAAGLAAEINLAGVGVKAAGDATSVTLTGYPGVVFDFIATGGGTGYTSSTTTPAAKSSQIGFGLAVVRETTDKEDVARLPSSATQKFLGVTLRSQMVQHDNGIAYPNTEPMPVVQMGSVWVPIEGTATVSDAVYVRLAASGTNTTLGKFSVTAGTGLVELTKARWITGGTNVAELFLCGSEAFV